MPFSSNFYNYFSQEDQDRINRERLAKSQETAAIGLEQQKSPLWEGIKGAFQFPLGFFSPEAGPNVNIAPVEDKNKLVGPKLLEAVKRGAPPAVKMQETLQGIGRTAEPTALEFGMSALEGAPILGRMAKGAVRSYTDEPEMQSLATDIPQSLTRNIGELLTGVGAAGKVGAAVPGISKAQLAASSLIGGTQSFAEQPLEYGGIAGKVKSGLTGAVTTPLGMGAASKISAVAAPLKTAAARVGTEAALNLPVDLTLGAADIVGAGMPISAIVDPSDPRHSEAMQQLAIAAGVGAAGSLTAAKGNRLAESAEALKSMRAEGQELDRKLARAYAEELPKPEELVAGLIGHEPFGPRVDLPPTQESGVAGLIGSEQLPPPDPTRAQRTTGTPEANAATVLDMTRQAIERNRAAGDPTPVGSLLEGIGAEQFAKQPKAVRDFLNAEAAKEIEAIREQQFFRMPEPKPTPADKSEAMGAAANKFAETEDPKDFVKGVKEARTDPMGVLDAYVRGASRGLDSSTAYAKNNEAPNLVDLARQRQQPTPLDRMEAYAKGAEKGLTSSTTYAEGKTAPDIVQMAQMLGTSKDKPGLAKRETIGGVNEPISKSAHAAGDKNYISIPSGDDIASQYELVSIESLSASNRGGSFQKNPNYKFRNTRDYETQTGLQAPIIRDAANIDPDKLLSRSLTNLEGPPVVTPDGQVLGGNGRVMRLDRAFAMHPEQVEKYNNRLREVAKEFGIPPEKVKPNSVLVRVVDVDNKKAQDVIPKLNWSTANSESDIELSNSIAGLMTDKELASLTDITGDETVRDVLRDRGYSLFQSLVKSGALPENSYNKYVDNNGLLTPEGRDVLESSIVAKVVGNPDVYSSMNSLEKDLVTRAAAPILRLKNSVSKGLLPPEADISKQFSKAIEALQIRGATVGQSVLFGDVKLDPITEELTRLLQSSVKNRGSFGPKMRKIADRIAEGEKLIAGETDLFGGEYHPDVEGILKAANNGDLFSAGEVEMPDLPPPKFEGESTTSRYLRSQEQKEFFGDWESDPANASKVIDPETGQPKVFDGIEGVRTLNDREDGSFSFVKPQPHRGESFTVNARNPLEMTGKDFAEFQGDREALDKLIADGYDSIVIPGDPSAKTAAGKKEQWFLLSDSQINAARPKDKTNTVQFGEYLKGILPEEYKGKTLVPEVTENIPEGRVGRVYTDPDGKVHIEVHPRAKDMDVMAEEARHAYQELGLMHENDMAKVRKEFVDGAKAIVGDDGSIHVLEGPEGFKRLVKSILDNDIESMDSRVAQVRQLFEKGGAPNFNEIDAKGYRAHVRGRLKSPTAVGRIWDTIKEFWTRTKNFISGKGFASATDTFRSFEQGKLKQGGPSEAIVELPLVRKGKDVTARFLTRNEALPESMHDALEDVHGGVALAEKNVERTSKELNAIVHKEFPGKVSPEIWEKINEGIKYNKEALKTLPESIQDAALKMRADVDVYTSRLIQSGIIPKDTIAEIRANEGVYLRTSYEIFDDPKHKDKVDQRIINKTMDWIRSENPGMNEQEVRGFLDYLLSAGDDANPLSWIANKSKAGGKNLTMLKRMKGIPPEIRALWGETKDPLVNYQKSVLGMAKALENHKFLETLLQEGQGKFIFDKPTTTPDGIRYTEEIAGKGNRAFEPITSKHGTKYTTKEIVQTLEDWTGKEAGGEAWFRAYMAVNAAVKVSKTVLSPMTQVRNVVANTGFAIANGHYDVGEIKEALKATYGNYMGGETGTTKQLVDDLIRLGLFNNTVDTQELKGILSDMHGGRLASGMSAGKSGLGKVLDVPFKAYQAGDEVWKAFGFLNEFNRYRKALPDATAEEIKRRAANIVKNVYPTYSRVGLAVRKLRRFPLIGTFVSFPAEVIRVGTNTVRLAASEVRDTNPAIRNIGYKRAFGILSAGLAPTAIAGGLQLMQGVTSEEKEQIREFVPPWSKNSDLAFLGRNDKGNLRYIDLSYSDPYAYLRKPVYAMLRGEDWEQSLLDGAAELLSPFVSEELLIGKLKDVSRNTKPTGGQVYNPEAPPEEQMLASMQHIWGAFEPGAISSLQRVSEGVKGTTNKYGKQYDPVVETAAMMSGFRLETLDPVQGVSFKASDFQRSLRNTTQIMSSIAGRRGNVDPQEILSAYNEMEVSRQERFDEMVKAVNAARKLGVSTQQLMKVLTEQNVTKETARNILLGKYKPYRPSKNLLERVRSGAKSVRSEQQQGELAGRLAALREASAAYQE